MQGKKVFVALAIRVRETACTILLSIGIRSGRDSDQQVTCVRCGSLPVALAKDQVAHCSGELIILVVVT